MKFLLFPLGNFGEKYEYTRHNAGRFVYNKLKEKKLLSEFLENKENNLEVFIPHTFMNESGQSLRDYIKNKNIEKENIIIIYDDKDLEIELIKACY